MAMFGGNTPKTTRVDRKRLRVESSTNKRDEISEKIPRLSENSKEIIDESQIDEELNEKYKQLKLVIVKKEEKLRKLKLVRTHHILNNLKTMEEIITKWKTVAQNAIKDYHTKLNESETKATLTQLIDHLSINHKLIDYNSEDEDFTN